jgi:hypothetical protein
MWGLFHWNIVANVHQTICKHYDERIFFSFVSQYLLKIASFKNVCFNFEQVVNFQLIWFAIFCFWCVRKYRIIKKLCFLLHNIEKMFKNFVAFMSVPQKRATQSLFNEFLLKHLNRTAHMTPMQENNCIQMSKLTQILKK